jgi:hypothetical protein
MTNQNKVCIIYWGLIRGFKHNIAFQSHKHYLYDYLSNNGIDFDVYIVTNNLEYDEDVVCRIPNIKMLKIININDIYSLEDYTKIYNKIDFTTSGWCEKYHKNLLTVYYNKQQLYNCISSDYKRYISMDIGQIINKLDSSLINQYENITSSYETSNGLNPRILLGNYSCIKAELNKFNFILNNNNKLKFLNPESFLVFYFATQNINIISSNMVNVLRIRSDGTNENSIPYSL